MNKPSTTSTGKASGSKVDKKKEPSLLTKLYLFLYNGGQTVGWSYMLYQLIAYYTTDVAKGQTLWDYIGWTVIIFQNAAILEIFNAFSGLVKSNPIITLSQVFSRVMVVCGVVMATPDAKISPGLPLALLAWTVTEIIRYSYYALNIINLVPYFLIWLRYTTFIILYPIGVTGELLCFYWAQNYVKKTGLWSIELPNKYNYTFSYLYLLWIIMLSYVPFFPQLYLHMFSQRRKIIGTGKPSSSGNTNKQKVK